MGIIGGQLGYWLLRKLYPGGDGVPMPSGVDCDRGAQKLVTFFTPEELADLKDKVVVDFGCGYGVECVALARLGARRVIGLDIQPDNLEAGRRLAERSGVADRVEFVTSTTERADVVLSLDSFEHFTDPAAILRLMHGLLKPDGYLLTSFGPTWLHPLGGHLFSVFPWAHLIFTEKALIRWRSDFKDDGASRFEEVRGGLNRMTVKRWEELVSESAFEIVWQRNRPIHAVRALHCHWTRELFTAVIQSRLRPALPV